MTNIEKYTQVRLQGSPSGLKEARAFLQVDVLFPVPKDVDLLSAVPPSIRSYAVDRISQMLIGDDMRKLRDIAVDLTCLPSAMTDLRAQGKIRTLASEMHRLIEQYRIAR